MSTTYELRPIAAARRLPTGPHEARPLPREPRPSRAVRAPRSRVDLQGVLVRLALVLLPLVSLSPVGTRSLSLGMLLLLAVAPVLAGALRGEHARDARRLTVLLLLAAACGPVLAELATLSTWRAHDPTLALQLMLLLVRGALLIGVLALARGRVSPRSVLLCFAVGALAQAYLDLAFEAAARNPWKYLFAWPVTALGLALVGAGSRRWAAVAVLAGSAALSVAFDFRSGAAVAVVALLFGLGRVREQDAAPAGGRRLTRVALLGLAVLALYTGGQQLAIAGHLGTQLQHTTAVQTADGRSLILGGRVELAAAVPLLLHRPWGYGPGVLPSVADVERAKAGLAGIHVDTGGKHVNAYMFGSGIQLHSVTNDLWVNFGLAGLAAAGAAWLVLARSLLRELVGARSPLVMWLGLQACWDMAFSPITGNMTLVVFSVAFLALAARQDPGVAGTGPEPARPAARPGRPRRAAASSLRGAA